MKKIFSYILLLLFELFSLNNNNIYKIQLGLYNQKDSKNNSNIIHNIFYNRIYLNLSIGTPNQIMPFELDITSQTFSASNKVFNKNQSLTYEQISESEVFFDYDDIISGYNSKDILNLDIFNNNYFSKKINFILGTKYQIDKNENMGIIGLSISKRGHSGVYPFFKSLKKEEIINYSIWTIKYNENINLFDLIHYNKEKDNFIGEFIFGDEPHNYESNKNKYNQKNYYITPALSDKGTIYWDIEFNNIYLAFDQDKFNKVFFSGEKYAEIMINYSFMIGPEKFFDFIIKKFFYPFINDKICAERKIQSFYYYIECDSDSNFKIESFPAISLEHIDLETTFNLTYKDLFILDENNKKYIFLIFKEEYLTNQVLGSIFLRKYQFIFNEDSKIIGYYKHPQEITPENKGNLNGSKKSNKGSVIVLIILISLLSMVFGMYIQRKCCSTNRKLRANELEESFSYEGKLTNDNTKENKNNKINEEDTKKNFYLGM